MNEVSLHGSTRRPREEDVLSSQRLIYCET